jgi:hypothetical protein
MKCRRCNRELKSDSSKLLGYGSTCAKIVGIIIVKPHKIKSKKTGDILTWI